MRSTITKIFALFAFILLLFSPEAANAQRTMEKLSRGLIARKVTNGYLVQWRVNSDEYRTASYKLYRDGNLIYESGISGASNFLDKSGSSSSVYTVSTVINGVESEQKTAIRRPLTQDFLEIKMREFPGSEGYNLNDATAADLDGDGEMEIIVKRLYSDWSNNAPYYSYFEAYKLDGTFLWAINVGPNITDDVEINIAAFDFDGDGKAEVFMRTSEGTIFGDGTQIGDTNKDGKINYRSTGQYMIDGPEFLSLIDGETGAELDRVDFIPRTFNGLSVNDIWGDGYGHRCSKYFFGAPYLDGEKPSLFIGRGIYTRTVMRTYDIVDKKIKLRWEFSSDNNPTYFGQGNHNYTIADTDGDGYDEIVWGSMCVDHDGKGLYSTELGHGDALHVGDFDPYHKGTEVFACNEDKPGINLRDGKTGKMLIRQINPSDVGRCCAANITDEHKGYEVWGGGKGYSATEREAMNHFGLAENYSIYWTGDLLKEILDHRGFSTSQGYGTGHITKYYKRGDIIDILIATGTASCNWTKGTPSLQADLLGDWREEVVWRSSDNKSLRIYLTPYETEHRIYTLLHDHQYRQAICWQMCGYNQPPHVSFYLGGEFPEPIPAKSTNGKLVWKGVGNDWSTSSQEWMDGNDLNGMIYGTAPLTSYIDNNQVLLDSRGNKKEINLTSNISPSVLTCADNGNYKISGSGKFTGNMMLDKMAEGTLSIFGKHDFEGECNVWEGKLCLNGEFSKFPVKVRRHAEFMATGIFDNEVLTEYNASVIIGSEKQSSKALFKKNMLICEGARLVIGVNDMPMPVENTDYVPSSTTNNIIEIEGILTFENKSFIEIISDNKLEEGLYYLGYVNNLEADFSNIKIDGTKGAVSELIYNKDKKALYLKVIGVRGAGDIIWNGNTNGIWDLSSTVNWSNEEINDIYVDGDNVVFDNNSTERNITIKETLSPSSMLIANGTYSFDGEGTLNGDMNLTLKENANVTINNRNNFTGKVLVDNSNLILKYASSQTQNGGIGVENTNASYLVLKDSATLKITNSDEILKRSITFEGEKGGIIYNDHNLFIDANALFTGTKLTKRGNGWLYIEHNNPNLKETEIVSGTIKLNTGAAYPQGLGKTIILRGGTLDTYNYAGGNGVSMSSNFVVPNGASGTVYAFPRCTYSGSLTGGGNLNWVTDMIRGYMNGNWSAFTGRINITKNGANSNYEDHFIVNNSYGYPNAEISIGDDVKFMYNNWASTTVKVGALSGTSKGILDVPVEVGNKNINTVFNGIVQGNAAIKKVGTGTQTFAGSMTSNSEITVSSGTLGISGTKTGTGAITVSAGATLDASGTINGSVILSTSTNTARARMIGNGTLKNNVTANTYTAISPADTTAIGTLVFESNLSMRANSVYECTFQGRGLLSTSDNITVDGNFTCKGKLVGNLIGRTIPAGAKFRVIKADNIIGEFSEIILPKISDEVDWDTSDLYNTGYIYAVKATSLNETEFKTGIVDNSTNGIYDIIFENCYKKVSYKISNSKGQIIVEKENFIPNVNEYIDITDREKGIYMLIIKHESGKTESFKLIKE